VQARKPMAKNNGKVKSPESRIWDAAAVFAEHRMRPGTLLAKEIVAELKAVGAEARRSNRALKGF